MAGGFWVGDFVKMVSGKKVEALAKVIDEVRDYWASDEGSMGEILSKQALSVVHWTMIYVTKSFASYQTLAQRDFRCPQNMG
jgi:hypothetical protein